ncbi:MAG: hypothetical protein IT449_08055 [Phycisphaerales bacterium]|nr:hypothetical protein [Phycisphaerales bacterium]
MLAEPEPLLRWSLACYLQRWFEVVIVQTLPEACEVARGAHVDAAVVTDAWPAEGLDRLESALERQDSGVRIVRLVTDQTRSRPSRRRESLLEKPFQLVDLARRLGVTPQEPD